MTMTTAKAAAPAAKQADPQRPIIRTGDIVRFPKKRCEQWRGQKVAVTLRNGPTVLGTLVDTREAGVWVDLDGAVIVTRDGERDVGEITICAANIGHCHLIAGA